MQHNKKQSFADFRRSIRFTLILIGGVVGLWWLKASKSIPRSHQSIQFPWRLQTPWRNDGITRIYSTLKASIDRLFTIQIIPFQQQSLWNVSESVHKVVSMARNEEPRVRIAIWRALCWKIVLSMFYVPSDNEVWAPLNSNRDRKSLFSFFSFVIRTIYVLFYLLLPTMAPFCIYIFFRSNFAYSRVSSHVRRARHNAKQTKKNRQRVYIFMITWITSTERLNLK